MIQRLTTRGHAVAVAIANHQSFTTGGALRAQQTARGVDTGRLPREWAQRFNARRDDVAYVVISYVTPIAWVLTDGTVVIPPVKYSVTTTKHQGNLYLLKETTR